MKCPNAVYEHEVHYTEMPYLSGLFSFK